MEYLDLTYEEYIELDKKGLVCWKKPVECPICYKNSPFRSSCRYCNHCVCEDCMYEIMFKNLQDATSVHFVENYLYMPRTTVSLD